MVHGHTCTMMALGMEVEYLVPTLRFDYSTNGLVAPCLASCSDILWFLIQIASIEDQDLSCHTNSHVGALLEGPVTAVATDNYVINSIFSKCPYF